MYCKSKNFIKYIPTYKMSQDHIELLFGCIRYQGCYNNNPTSIQFKAAFKKIIPHSEIKDTGMGNVVSLDSTVILHILTNVPSQCILNRSHQFQKETAEEMDANWQDICNILDDHNYHLDCLSFSEYSRRVVEYIAGFIVRYLQRTISCETCIIALNCQTDDKIQYQLINRKNRGHLIFPSRSVIRLCTDSEKVIRVALKQSGGKFLKKTIRRNISS